MTSDQFAKDCANVQSLFTNKFQVFVGATSTKIVFVECWDNKGIPCAALVMDNNMAREMIKALDNLLRKH